MALHGLSMSAEASRFDEACGTPPNSPLSLPGNGKQKCLHVDIILPDGTLHQVEVDCKANGKECLDKICNNFGIFEEVDYFGLTFLGAKQEELWVNMRNRLYRQLPATTCRMHLRVKFFVKPHMLLLNETRHMVFLDARTQMIDHGNCIDEWKEDKARMAEAIALLTQAEFGDFDASRIPIKYQKYWREGDIPTEMIGLTAERHRRLAGTPTPKAEYAFLQLASSLEMYGCSYHEVKDCYENKLCVAVGPSAIYVCRENRTVIERYPYPRVQKVTLSDRVLYLLLSQENGSVRDVGYRLVSQRAANGLYRCVTETHSFFRCDTVRSDVSAQTSRDIKGALVSFFIEHDPANSRDFVFDIQRTAKEVHDDARRRLFKCSSAANSPTSISATFSFDSLANSGDEQGGGSGGGQAATTTTAVSTTLTADCDADRGGDVEVAQLKEKLESLEQSRMCRVCMDASINVVFVPCGHMVSCRSCAEQLAACVVCREEISLRQSCFAPWNA